MRRVQFVSFFVFFYPWELEIDKGTRVVDGIGGLQQYTPQTRVSSTITFPGDWGGVRRLSKEI
jgi:hypothetical protein